MDHQVRIPFLFNNLVINVIPGYIAKIFIMPYWIPRNEWEIEITNQITKKE